MIISLLNTNCKKVPEKPEIITKGDYSYVVKYSEFKVNELVSKKEIPAVSIALIDEDNIIWKNAFGTTEPNGDKEASVNDVYKAGSIAKAITFTALFKLYDDGKIRLEDPVSKYIKDFDIKSRFRNTKPISIRSIVCGRSGLPRDSEIASMLIDIDSERLPLKKIISELSSIYTAYPPDSMYKDSNINTNIAGRILEIKSGNTFDKHIDSTVFDKLAMTESSFNIKDVNTSQILKGYINTQNTKEPVIVETSLRNDIPSGNFYTTITDLSKYASMILSYGNGYIKPETIRMMLTDTYSRPQDPWKQPAGWNIRTFDNKYKLIEINSAYAGFSGVIKLLPDLRIGLVMLSNSSDFITKQGSLSKKILRLMIEAKQGKKYDENEMRSDIENAEIEYKPSKDKMAKIDGLYSFGGFTAETTVGNNLINLTAEKIKNFPIPMPFDIKVTLLPKSENVFNVDNWIFDRINEDINISAEYIPEIDFLSEFGYNTGSFLLTTINKDLYFRISKIKPDENLSQLKNLYTGEYKLVINGSHYGLDDDIDLLNMKIIADNGFLKLVPLEILYQKFIDVSPVGASNLPSVSILLKAVSETELTIQDGVLGLYDGETVFRDTSTGVLNFMDLRLIPIQ